MGLWSENKKKCSYFNFSYVLAFSILQGYLTHCNAASRVNLVRGQTGIPDERKNIQPPAGRKTWLAELFTKVQQILEIFILQLWVMLVFFWLPSEMVMRPDVKWTVTCSFSTVIFSLNSKREVISYWWKMCIEYYLGGRTMEVKQNHVVPTGTYKW